MGAAPDAAGKGTPDKAALKRAFRLGERFKAAAAVKLPTLADIASESYVAPTPVVRELVYPGAWLLVGRPKIGKSWLLLQLALAVAEGGTFLGFYCAQGEVLFIASEDDARRIKARLEALGVAHAPPGCHILNRSNLPGVAKEFSDDMSFENWLLLWLKSHPAVKLVVIDTEVTVRQIWTGECQSGTAKITETDYKATREFDEIALKRQVAIVLVNHTGKLRGGKTGDLHELINRSMTAVAGASGSIVIADPPGTDPLDPGQRLRVLGVRGRDLDHDVMLAVHQEKDMPYFLSDGIFREVAQTNAEHHVLEALKELMAQLGEEDFATSTDVAAAAGMSVSTVRWHLCRMAQRSHYGLKVKLGRKGGYRLSPFPPDPP